MVERLDWSGSITVCLISSWFPLVAEDLLQDMFSHGLFAKVLLHLVFLGSMNENWKSWKPFWLRRGGEEGNVGGGMNGVH